ncbi:MAG: hypothetical protein KKF44_05685 [Nanoarchaeota archaeon]|nr:hypothetical protein [Nanoarchaeota archaeon]
MGIFDALPFGKKKEEFGDDFLSKGKNIASTLPQDNMGLPPLEAPPLNPIRHTALPDESNPAPFDSIDSIHGSDNSIPQMGAPLGQPSFTDPISSQNNSTSAYSFPPPTNAASGAPSDPQQQQEYNDYPSSSQPMQQKPRPNLLEKDLELISTKLDYLKAALENISQRLANIERQGEAPRQEDLRW